MTTQWLSYWLTDCLTDWTGCLTDGLATFLPTEVTGCLFDWLIYWIEKPVLLSDRLTEWLTQWLINLPTFYDVILWCIRVQKSAVNLLTDQWAVQSVKRAGYGAMCRLLTKGYLKFISRNSNLSLSSSLGVMTSPLGVPGLLFSASSPPGTDIFWKKLRWRFSIKTQKPLSTKNP